MSWSFSCVGKPENVAAAIEAYGETLTGQSKVEFDDAAPHLVALVRQTFVGPESRSTLPGIDFEASGSGVVSGGVQTQRSCSVAIKPVWKMLV